MGIKGTDYGTWTGLTSTVNSSVTNITDIAELSFATTTMTPIHLLMMILNHLTK